MRDPSSGLWLAELRNQFPMLRQEVNGHQLVYLDNAATMQMPECVMKSVDELWRTSNSNVHRGAHSVSQIATERFEASRTSVAQFLGCTESEVILTSGTTDGLNKLAEMMASRIGPGDRIVVSQMEHHSNLLPWMRVASTRGAELVMAPIKDDGSLDVERLVALVDLTTKVIAVTQLSNVSGAMAPLSCVYDSAKDAGAFMVVDGAQGAAHLEAMAVPSFCDAYAFSGHKLGAPTGTGALYVREAVLEGLQPTFLGGGAVASVERDGFTLHPDIRRFEPGTPNYQGFVGMDAAISFWTSRDRRRDLSHEHALLDRLESGLRRIEGLHVVAPDIEHFGAVSVWAESGTSFDLCRLIDSRGIATRSGLHCAHPYLDAIGQRDRGVLRISVAPYNTDSEIDACLEALELAVSVMKGR